jgi:LysR family transcriptional regulator, glycine cleavage system transcriptional activator
MRRSRAVSEVRARLPSASPPRAPWLPPLHALHAFEAAGRHLSFKNAAAELCVTPSAVSRQIKQLEDQLGVALFVRGSALTLTTAGRRYLEVVQAAFAALVDGTQRVRAARGTSLVRITCVQALAANWLVPRLDLLTERHPEIEVQIVTGDALLDIAAGQADLAIRFGQGSWPGVASQRLFELRAFPVCAPALAKRLRVPRDLLTVPWLHLVSYPRAFRDWLVAAEVPDATAKRNLSFDSAELVFRAAERGLGAAMATTVLVEPYLQSKRLVQPFAVTVPVAGSYFLVDRPEDRREPAVAAVRAFLLEIAAATSVR